MRVLHGKRVGGNDVVQVERGDLPAVEPPFLTQPAGKLPADHPRCSGDQQAHVISPYAALARATRTARRTRRRNRTATAPAAAGDTLPTVSMMVGR